MMEDHEMLVEKVARAMCRERHPCWSIVGEIFERDYERQATEFRNYAITAVKLVLEEAAKVADTCRHGTEAASIRALKGDT